MTTPSTNLIASKKISEQAIQYGEDAAHQAAITFNTKLKMH
jgi:hypothetical protein